MTLTIQKPRDIEALRHLYRDLHGFGEALREAAVRFQDLVRSGHFPENGRTFRFAQDDPMDVLNRSVDITRRFEFLVAVTGAFSSGKSTLLNLLLEHEDLLPASAIPLTAVCTAIRYGDEPRIEVRHVPFEQAFARIEATIGKPFKQPFRDAAQIAEAIEHPEAFVADESAQRSLQRSAQLLARFDALPDPELSFQKRAPWMAGGGLLRESDGSWRYFRPTPNEERQFLAAGGDQRRWITREWLALIRDVTLWIPSPLLRNDVVFLDLPGLNCREDYHRRAIREYCNLADCVVLTAFQPGNQADTDVLASFKSLSANYHDKVFFVFNKVDQFAREPQELVRAVDYLARDTIGTDFPRERFFLTSAALAKGRREGQTGWQEELERLSSGLAGVRHGLPGLESWVGRTVEPGDPGGVGALRRSLWTFLVEDAWPAKVQEIVGNYARTVGTLRHAAAPEIERAANAEPADLLRENVRAFHRHVQATARAAVESFRFDYLRGTDGHRSSPLRSDLERILELSHRDMRERITAHFDRPILAAPIVDDPVSDFELLRIADEACEHLRRELLDALLAAVHGHVQDVFERHVTECDVHQQVDALFATVPEARRAWEAAFERFDRTMLHSVKCIVRTGFFLMPRGRRLKRLARPVPLADLKTTLVTVFDDFYPAWVYENVYCELMEKLWLSLFLDCEDFLRDLDETFANAEPLVTAAAAAERITVPPGISEGCRDRYRVLRMCRDIRDLDARREELEARAAELGVRS